MRELVVSPAIATGSVVDWISAVGEVVGAVGTLAAVIVALWLARLDRQRIWAELEDREAGQARLVTFEVVRRGGRWRVQTTNHSVAPVFDVRVIQVRCGDQVGHVDPIPGTPKWLAMVRAGESMDQVITFNDLEVDGTCEVTAFFLDSAGLRWQRTGTDPPRRVLK
jgi:hypothetical protein